MAHQPYDRSGTWLLQHHGGALLKLGGVERIRSWRAAQAEVVQARQLPDGLLEVEFDRATDAQADPAPGLYVVEIATYPEQRLLEQVARDVASVFLDRGQLPEALTIVLRPHPRSPFQVAGEHDLKSPQGWTRWQMSWRVVELWSIPAEKLFRGCLCRTLTAHRNRCCGSAGRGSTPRRRPASWKICWPLRRCWPGFGIMTRGYWPCSAGTQTRSLR